MANTTVPSGNQVKKFLADFFKEYVRESRYAPYTGTGNNAVVTIKEGKQQIHIPLITSLKGAGVSGSSTLRGSGEQISQYGMTLTPTYYRHAVEFDQEELDKPAYDLMMAARPLLMDWAMEKTRDQVTQAMNAIYNGTTYSNYGDTAAGAFDTWLTNNDDRILYGAAKSNMVAGNHTSSLAAINTTDDKMTANVMSIAKRMAQQANPRIRPLKVSGDREMFVCFHDPYTFRNLAGDSAIKQAQREVVGKSDPIFQGGGFMYENIWHIEVPEIAEFIDGNALGVASWGANSTADSLATGGASSSRVGVSFLCGQQAVGFGLGQRPSVVVDKDYDFGFQPGVAVQLKHDIDKVYFNNVQHGMVTIFTSAAVDA
jgi:N4-gp56 family major capsid protein